jgi:colanic acid/amylovoran biosynthesis glycosyltransferase
MPADYYDELKEVCSCYLVMSEDMKRRVVAHGFPPDQVEVHPVSIDVDTYPFRLRTIGANDELRLISVGRMVEKKGFDDLLRALAIVKERASRSVSCEIVGGGPLEPELRALTESLDLFSTVTFRGFMPIEEILELFDEMHVFVQPSKTAADGDME